MSPPTARADPIRAAFRLIERPDGAALFHAAGRVVTVAEFLARAAAIAAQLPDAPVVNACADHAAFAATFAACLLRNRPCVLAGDRSPARLRLLAERHGGAVLVSDGPIATDLPCLVPQPGGIARGENPLIPADRIAAIVYTSGSTGAPVAHGKSWGALATRSLQAGRSFGLNEAAPAAIVATVPPGHMYGFETGVLLPLHAACAGWSGPAFYPADVADALHAVPGPRWLVTTPLQLRVLLESGGALPPLAGVISATAPLDPALAAAAEGRWKTAVWEIFGATEVGSVARRRTVAEAAWTPYAGVVLSGGDPPMVHAPHAAPHPLSDRVTLDPDGRFRLLGRQGDVVKLGGRRASLAGLDRVLVGLDGVQDGAFLAPEAPDRDPGARMVAFVVAPGRTATEILAALRDRIDPAFLPRRVIALAALPRDGLGKLPRGALRTLAAEA